MPNHPQVINRRKPRIPPKTVALLNSAAFALAVLLAIGGIVVAGTFLGPVLAVSLGLVGTVCIFVGISIATVFALFWGWKEVQTTNRGIYFGELIKSQQTFSPDTIYSLGFRFYGAFGLEFYQFPPGLFKCRVASSLDEIIFMKDDEEVEVSMRSVGDGILLYLNDNVQHKLHEWGVLTHYKLVDFGRMPANEFNRFGVSIMLQGEAFGIRNGVEAELRQEDDRLYMTLYSDGESVEFPVSPRREYNKGTRIGNYYLAGMSDVSLSKILPLMEPSKWISMCNGRSFTGAFARSQAVDFRLYKHDAIFILPDDIRITCRNNGRVPTVRLQLEGVGSVDLQVTNVELLRHGISIATEPNLERRIALRRLGIEMPSLDFYGAIRKGVAMSPSDLRTANILLSGNNLNEMDHFILPPDMTVLFNEANYTVVLSKNGRDFTFPIHDCAILPHSGFLSVSTSPVEIVLDISQTVCQQLDLRSCRKLCQSNASDITDMLRGMGREMQITIDEGIFPIIREAESLGVVMYSAQGDWFTEIIQQRSDDLRPVIAVRAAIEENRPEILRIYEIAKTRHGGDLYAAFLAVFPAEGPDGAILADMNRGDIVHAFIAQNGARHEIKQGLLEERIRAILTVLQQISPDEEEAAKLFIAILSMNYSQAYGDCLVVPPAYAMGAIQYMPNRRREFVVHLAGPGQWF
ncbi:MAG: hypothetical protein LBC42_02625, partial [Puniceicoccales bacterium]|nr:hypothetical protein [Puniceicoccales bacterium]